MSFLGTLALIVGSDLGRTFIERTDQMNQGLQNIEDRLASMQGETGLVNQDRIEYLERKIELLEAQLSGKKIPKADPKYASRYPEFAPEDISHDGVYVRTKKGWMPHAWVSYNSLSEL